MKHKNICHRFYCYSLFKAGKVNDFLLWAISIGLIGSYFLMYFVLPAKDELGQWRVFLVNNAFSLFGSSIIVYNAYKGTSLAGVATFWLISCVILFICAIFGLTRQIFWVEAVLNVFILGFLLYILYDVFFRRTR